SKIKITHPHTYADESHAAPELVTSISDALDSDSPDPVPELVIWAGEEAARTRSPRVFRDSFPGGESDTQADTPVTTSWTTIRCSFESKDLPGSPFETSASDSERPASFQHPVSSKRPPSFEKHESQQHMGLASLSDCGSQEELARVQNSFFRRFVLAWKRVT
ncbi:hypothetical protein DFH11DRAFT_1493440, partial [Phellopilus nigrolimitatus]